METVQVLPDERDMEQSKRLAIDAALRKINTQSDISTEESELPEDLSAVIRTTGVLPQVIHQYE